MVENTNRPADDGDQARDPLAPGGGPEPTAAHGPPDGDAPPPPNPPPEAPAPPPLAQAAPEPPLAQAVPPMSLASTGLSSDAEDRIRRLEQALRGLEELQRQSAATPGSGIRPSNAPAPAKGPSLFGRAAAWVGSLGPLARDAVLGHAHDPSLPRPARPWFLLDALADARAIVRMYTDPRYSLTWMGRLLPPALLLAFLTVHLWLPVLLPCIGWLLLKVPGLGWVLEKVLELLIGFLLFRALGQEARRYRETAPDLPPSLRL